MKYKKSCGIILGVVCLMLTGCHMKHDWLEATCTEPRTCIVGGETEGEPLGHTWEEATCTTAKVCNVCGETEGGPLGHTWEEATCTTAKMCNVCRETEGEPLGHTWEYVSCTEPDKCSICGADGEVPGHDWNVEYACLTDKICNRCQEIDMYAQKHMLDESGKCFNCNEQVGIMLTVNNFGSYLNIQPTTIPKSGYYEYELLSESTDRNYAFYDVEVSLSLYLTSDISLGVNGAISETLGANEKKVKLYSDGSYVYPAYVYPRDSDDGSYVYQGVICRKNNIYTTESSGLVVYGYVYDVEGFCYDTRIAVAVVAEWQSEK